MRKLRYGCCSSQINGKPWPFVQRGFRPVVLWEVMRADYHRMQAAAAYTMV
jgi:hypothetical protein